MSRAVPVLLVGIVFAAYYFVTYVDVGNVLWTLSTPLAHLMGAQ